VKGVPEGRHLPRDTSGHALASRGRPRARRSRGGWRATLVLLGALGVGVAALPASTALANPGSPASGGSTLSKTLAEATKLSNEIDVLGQQYDGLRIQLSQARADAAIARQDAARDAKLLGSEQTYINAIAVEGYMNGGFNPALQLLQSATPQSMLNRASIMTQLEQQNGDKVNLIVTAEAAAQRATAAANLEEKRAVRLKAAMAGKVAQIQQKENFFNSKAFAQAAAIYQQTGRYPDIHPTGDSVGVQALKWALTKVGDPYVWGAAGPSAFDCSGLVVWAYAQVGISLMHFTGDLWNEGEHVSRSELKPGDLVFFFPNISHVGIYVGNGLMVDAPTQGQNVQVQPVFWSAFVGAVRIVA
jgi:cell wall-associated NlpC family hydrolase